MWLQPLAMLLESKEDKVWGKSFGSNCEESVTAMKSEGVGWGKEERVSPKGVGPTKKLDHGQAASMAIVMSGMVWTQVKKHACNLAEGEHCLVCGEVNTSLHRCTSCLGS